jgi:hypothetical protein
VIGFTIPLKRENPMYVLVNQFNSTQGQTIGTVLSTHRTVGNAVKSDHNIQYGIRKNNPNSYLPTCIKKVDKKFGKGHHLSVGEAKDLNVWEFEETIGDY